jgi:hypothetical protein
MAAVEHGGDEDAVGEVAHLPFGDVLEDVRRVERDGLKPNRCQGRMLGRGKDLCQSMGHGRSLQLAGAHGLTGINYLSAFKGYNTKGIPPFVAKSLSIMAVYHNFCAIDARRKKVKPNP